MATSGFHGGGGGVVGGRWRILCCTQLSHYVSGSGVGFKVSYMDFRIFSGERCILISYIFMVIYLN